MKKRPYPIWKMVLIRFTKGFLAAFIPMFSTFATMSPKEWQTAAVVSLLIASVSGGLMAIDKWMKEEMRRF